MRAMRVLVTSCICSLAAAGCANDPAASAPTTVAEVGEVFLTAVYDGDTATWEGLADGDFPDVRFLSALLGELDAVTSDQSCQESREGRASCRVNGTDQLNAALAPDREVIDLWELDVTDLRVTDVAFQILLPPETQAYLEDLFARDATAVEVCGDFAAGGDPAACARAMLDGLDDAG